MAAININKEQFEVMKNNNKPVLVEFWAPWCVYCRRLGPAYDRIAQEYENIVNIVKLDIDSEPEIAEAEQIEIVPTLVLYRNGEAIDSIVVPDSKAMIDNFLKQALEIKEESI